MFTPEQEIRIKELAVEAFAAMCSQPLVGPPQPWTDVRTAVQTVPRTDSDVFITAYVDGSDGIWKIEPSNGWHTEKVVFKKRHDELLLLCGSDRAAKIVYERLICKV
jgi:hypothetical protein